MDHNQSEKTKSQSSNMTSSNKSGIGACSNHLQATSSSGVTMMAETSIETYSRSCQTLGVPWQSQGFTYISFLG